MDNDEYRNKYYPNLHPCMDNCKYWRDVCTGSLTGRSAKACHYNIDNDELRGDYPDLINGTCSKYVEGKGKSKRVPPYYLIRR